MAPRKGPGGALALTGTGPGGSSVGRCPCLQMTRARTTSLCSRSRVWQGYDEATTSPGRRQGGGDDGNHPWITSPAKHRAGMLSGSRFPLPSASERKRSCAGTTRSAGARHGSGAWSPAEQSPFPQHHSGHLGQVSVPLGAEHDYRERKHQARAAPRDAARTLPYSSLGAQYGLAGAGVWDRGPRAHPQLCSHRQGEGMQNAPGADVL